MAAACPVNCASGTQADPPTGEQYEVARPGCPNQSIESSGSSGTWTRVSAGDYSGYVDYGDTSADGSCGDVTAYTLTTSTQTAQFRWHFYDAVSYYYNERSKCYVYAYILTVGAGDYHARYDFYEDSGGAPLTWVAWPGQTFNQEAMSGWYYIGSAIVTAGNCELAVALSNADSSDPGWDAGAGAMAASCVVD